MNVSRRWFFGAIPAALAAIQFVGKGVFNALNIKALPDYAGQVGPPIEMAYGRMRLFGEGGLFEGPQYMGVPIREVSEIRPIT